MYHHLKFIYYVVCAKNLVQNHPTFGWSHFQNDQLFLLFYSLLHHHHLHKHLLKIFCLLYFEGLFIYSFNLFLNLLIQVLTILFSFSFCFTCVQHLQYSILFIFEINLTNQYLLVLKIYYLSIMNYNYYLEIILEYYYHDY